MELEDEYRFDPESVADMIEEGADVQELADQLCETMIVGLEQRASEVVGLTTTNCPAPDSPQRHTDMEEHRMVGDIDSCMTPPDSPTGQCELSESNVPWKLSRRSMVARSSALNAARKSIVARSSGADCDVHEKMKLVEQALADAEMRHRCRLSQAMHSVSGGADSLEPIGPQSLNESRIQEAVSLMYMSQTPEATCSSHIGPSQELLELALKQCGEVEVAQVVSGREWLVVGGQDVGGILVRSGQSLNSGVLLDRLAFGARLEELEVTGNRLHYRKRHGQGPAHGWVSLQLPSKSLVVPLDGTRCMADRKSVV